MKQKRPEVPFSERLLERKGEIISFPNLHKDGDKRAMMATYRSTG